MAKYIDADKLKAEIERYIKDVKDAEKRLTPNMGFFDAKLSGIYDVMSIVDSLQQEQQEVDLEEDETVTDCNEYSTVEEELDAFIKSGKAIKEENCGTYTTTYIDPLKVACHFYQLGLNTRKI